MDPRCSPQWIGDAHLADKLAYFYRHGRSSAAVIRFPSPIRTVPTDYGPRSDDCKCAIHLGKQSADASQYQPVNRSLSGLAGRSTLICCLSTRISAASATCDRNRSLAIPKINRHKSSIGYLHRAILSQLPARLNLRQGQVVCGRSVPLYMATPNGAT
jgi:hypothetical protein